MVDHNRSLRDKSDLLQDMSGADEEESEETYTSRSKSSRCLGGKEHYYTTLVASSISLGIVVVDQHIGVSTLATRRLNLALLGLTWIHTAHLPKLTGRSLRQLTLS